MIALTAAWAICPRAAPSGPCLARFLTGSALAGIAFINTFGALGGFVGPTMVGYVREKSGSFSGGLLVLAGLLVVAGVGTLVLKRAALLRED
jgi:cyanate permease